MPAPTLWVNMLRAGEGAGGNSVSAVWMRARAQMRHRWRATVALALLTALAGGVVLTAWAGARRTDSAYGRYLQATNAADFLVSTNNSGSAASQDFYRALSRLPEVARAGLASGSILASETKGRADVDNASIVQPMMSQDGKAEYSVGGVKLLAGRMPRPDRPSEILVNDSMARARHLHPGSAFTLYAVPATGPGQGDYQADPSTFVPVRFTVTGVGVTADEIVPVAPNDGLQTAVLTPAYYRAHHQPDELAFDGVYLRLRPGADHPAFQASVERMARKFTGSGGIGGLFVADLRQPEARVERAIHPEALALDLFAGLVALVAFLAIGQVVARESSLANEEDDALRAMGVRRAQLVGASVLRMALPVTIGAVGAVVLAVAASPLMPIGIARVAETRPGLAVDPLVLGSGFAAIVVLLCGVCVWARWRVSAPRPISTLGAVARPSRLVEAVARAGARPSAVVGFRMALEPGRGRTAVPVRSALVGITLAVAALVAVVTFGANLGRLVSTPELYGVTWSYGVDAQFGALARDQVERTVAQVPGVAAVAGGYYGDSVLIDGHAVPTVAIESIHGSIVPTMVTGHEPRRSDEVALGARTLRELGVSIGDTVTLKSQGVTHHLRVVGQVVLPSLGRGSFTPTDLGEGALTRGSAVAQAPAGKGNYNFVLLRYAAGVDPAATTKRLLSLADCPGDQCAMSHGRVLPNDVRSYASVRSTPVLLAGVLALLGAAALGHAVFTSVRRRRRDLALLKTFGFEKRQVRATVACQVSTFAVIGSALGIPLGIVLGRWLWTAFADQLGVPPAPMVPLYVVLVVPAVLVAANVIGALPAREAARTRPSVVLRSE